MFRALAERLAMARAPVPSELVEDLENDFPRLMEQRRDFVGDDDDAATVVADDPFPVGATVELHGLVSNPAANGRRVIVVQTPPDVAERGRISVNLDGAVRAVKRENVRAVPGGVGAAPSTAAMAWLTPGFLSIRLWPPLAMGVGASVQ